MRFYFHFKIAFKQSDYVNDFILNNIDNAIGNEDQEFRKPIKNEINEVKSNNESNYDEIKFEDDILGRGGQGQVITAFYRRTKVAVKCIDKSKSADALTEINILKKLNHPNIILLIDVAESKTQHMLILELFPGQSLEKIIHNPETRSKYYLLEKEKDKIAHDIALAITFCHLQKPLAILHRDLKPDNILVYKTGSYIIAKVCDFGVGKITDIHRSMQDTMHENIAGTIYYLAPEIVIYRKIATVYSDSWSYFATLKELYSHDTLWSTQRLNPVTEAVQKMTNKVIPSTNNVPLAIEKVMKKAFNYIPEHRPTVEETEELIFKKLNGLFVSIINYN